MESEYKILFAIVHQGWIRPEMLRVVDMVTCDPRVKVQTIELNVRPYEDALNSLAKMMRDGDYDYLLSFDHDNVPTKNPVDLVFLGKDIVGMPYPGYRVVNGVFECGLLAMDLKEDGKYLDHKTTTSLQEVDAVASGAIVVSKRVFDKGILFEREWKDGFATRGIDFNFCKRAKEKGFSIWAHYDYPASHFKEIDLLHLI